MTTEKNIKSQTRAWSLYDWANSVYSLTITTAIFPIYFENVTGNGTGMLTFWGREMQNTALYSYILAFSFLLVSLINPLLSGLSDVAGFRKRFMSFFAFLGSIACIFLYGFTENTLWIGITGFSAATIGYAGSLVFYNAYLPEITTPDNYDKVSAQGYAMGYIGSIILLIVNLFCIEKYDLLGFDNVGQATRFSFLTVGLWWGVFGFYSIWKLPAERTVIAPQKLLIKGYKEIQEVYKNIRKVPLQRKFLFSFFFYSMGVQTVMYIATLFGTVELKLPTDRLIMVILIIQLVAIAGAYLFAYISKRRGVFVSLILMILIWTGVCVGAYFTTKEWEFYLLAVVVGAVMGGIQSQSRSAFASLLPKHKDNNASYFSFYEVTEKIAIVAGTFSYGVLIEITGGMRNSVLLLTSFFLVGLVLMWQLIRIKSVTLR